MESDHRLYSFCQLPCGCGRQYLGCSTGRYPAGCYRRFRKICICRKSCRSSRKDRYCTGGPQPRKPCLFFVSFAPYSNPEIAVTVNIPYGYAGTNAATLGKKVYEILLRIYKSGAGFRLRCFQCIKCNCWRLKRGEMFLCRMESLLKAARRV